MGGHAMGTGSIGGRQMRLGSYKVCHSRDHERIEVERMEGHYCVDGHL